MGFRVAVHVNQAVRWAAGTPLLRRAAGCTCAWVVRTALAAASTQTAAAASGRTAAAAASGRNVLEAAAAHTAAARLRTPAVVPPAVKIHESRAGRAANAPQELQVARLAGYPQFPWLPRRQLAAGCAQAAVEASLSGVGGI